MKNSLTNAQPGDVVAVDFGPYIHVGILSDRRDGRTTEPLVLSATRRRGAVAEEPISAFAQGRAVVRHGYPGALPRSTVLARARALVGRPWHLLFDNCEHFVREVHGVPRASPQIRAAAAVALIFFIVASGE